MGCTIRRPTRPGMHGKARRRAPSEYGQQLREKQKFQFSYGLREAQMRRIFDDMDNVSKQFILNSPDGPEFLYDKAKKLANSGFIPEKQRFSGNFSRGSALPAENKTNPRETIVSSALAAYRKGDARGFEERMNALNRR